MQMLYGKNFHYNSPQQALALSAVLNRNVSPLTVVLPTGAGKSALFLIAAAANLEATVVVICPFVSLLAQVVEAAQNVGVDALCWNSNMNRMPNLLAVSADRFFSDACRNDIFRLEQRGKLTHIFVDEAHVLLLQASFRESMVRFVGLQTYRAPICFLTATLPPGEEEAFNAHLGFSSSMIVRDQTNRWNLRHSAEDVATNALVDTAVRLVLKQDLSDSERGIVFVRSLDRGQEVVALLKSKGLEANVQTTRFLRYQCPT